MEISEKIRLLRIRKGMSQEELAEKLNVSRQSISKWESGQSLPEISRLSQLCKFFQISADRLIDPKLGIDDEPRKSSADPQYICDIENSKKYYMKGYIRGKILIFTFCWLIFFTILTKLLSTTISDPDDAVSSVFLPANSIFSISLIGITAGLIIMIVNRSRLKRLPEYMSTKADMKQESRDQITGTRYFKIGLIILMLPALLTAIIPLILNNIIVPKIQSLNPDLQITATGLSPTLVMNIVTGVLFIAFIYVLVGVIIIINGKIKSRKNR